MKKATKMYEADPTNVNEAKEVLKLFYEEKTKRIIRARARWREHGQRNTKYFLNLEKRNNVKNHIRKLLVSGVISTNPYKILDKQKRFYHDLYKSRSTDMDCNTGETFLSNLYIPKLSKEQKQSCEGEISLEEIKLILDSFQNNKSPGNDGIPIEFIKPVGT